MGQDMLRIGMVINFAVVGPFFSSFACFVAETCGEWVTERQSGDTRRFPLVDKEHKSVCGSQLLRLGGRW
jgi:hypothetical protein